VRERVTANRSTLVSSQIFHGTGLGLSNASIFRSALCAHNFCVNFGFHFAVREGGEDRRGNIRRRLQGSGPRH